MKSSELIVNPDGSIYHLHLLPGQVAQTIFLVGDPERVGRVSRHFDHVELQVNRREFTTHTGKIGDKRLSVISTGIGTDNVDIVLNEVDALFNIDFDLREIRKQHTSLNFIRLGTTGSTRTEIAVDSTICSHFAIGMDALGSFYHHPIIQLPTGLVDIIKAAVPHCYVVRGDPALCEHYAQSEHQNVTLTAPGFYAPQGRELRLASGMADVVSRLGGLQADPYRVSNIEMETAGIYLLAGALGHRAVSLSVVLANRASRQFSREPLAAVDALIADAISKVINLP